MSIEQKLVSLGYTLEPADLYFGKFVQAVKVGNLVFTSGQVPIWGDTVIKGKVGGDVTPEQGYEAAKLCTLNCLRAVKAITGSLDRVTRVVKVLGMVNVAPGFDQTSSVINGCSDFLYELFGKENGHARSAVGMTLPLNFAVEVEMIAEVMVD